MITYFPSQILYDEKVIDNKSIGTRNKLARALARQWFGAPQMMFRCLAREVRNLEHPFLKEFFPWWVGSCGCPVVSSSNGWGDMAAIGNIVPFKALPLEDSTSPKKVSKADGSDDNGDVAPDAAPESPLLWFGADPEMGYLAEIHSNQPVQMPSGEVRIEAAFALARTASEENDWTGLLLLIKFYKGRRFDATIGLPKPNDFRDIPEYFALEYNDNNNNIYSDVFWLAALIESIGELEFGQLSILLLSSLLKRIAQLLQFDRLIFLFMVADQVKLGMHAMRLCQMRGSSDSDYDINSLNLVALLHLFEGRVTFNNVFLHHYLFCILQIFAGKTSISFVASRVMGADPFLELPPKEEPNLSALAIPETAWEPDTVSSSHEQQRESLL
ncbi:hypothetical protein CDL15_Pgr014661 [Punica granatum]|uniref:Transcription initiation factor TFIID subunit 2 Ig-like domain-containing protein n=1 Tax=Punica granatum TaxID=22663 RepID=A0A218Y0J8_PUNGR|nr:hypothetical protein CDL15_Pgr014661 [Punica granatum]